MVLLNGTKYSCETCIKGHRTSSCKHTDRLLIEIKKKGRPQTQCGHCRELRKTKQMHVKCLCAPLKGGAPPAPSSDAPPTPESPQSSSPTIPACAQGPECPCCIPRKRPPVKRKLHASAHRGVEQDLVPSLARSPSSSSDSGAELDDLSSRSSHTHVPASTFSPYLRAYDLHHDLQSQEAGAAQDEHDLILPLLYGGMIPRHDSQSDYPSSLDELFGGFPGLPPQASKPLVVDDPPLDLSKLDHHSFMDLFNPSFSEPPHLVPAFSFPGRDSEGQSPPSSGPSMLSDAAVSGTNQGNLDPTFGTDPTWMLSEDPSWLVTPTFIPAES